MFSRVAVATLLALPLLAVADGSCNTGPIQCCNSMEQANSAAGSALLSAIGVVLDNTDVALGLKCSPISVISAGGGSCDANPVCCQNNNVGGLVSIGCVPVEL